MCILFQIFEINRFLETRKINKKTDENGHYINELILLNRFKYEMNIVACLNRKNLLVLVYSN